MGIQLLNGSVSDDTIYCKVRRDAVTNVRGKVFDLTKNQYNLLIAAGASVTRKCKICFPIFKLIYFLILANSVTYHGVAYLASGEKQSLSDVSALAAASKLLVRLHGSFMIAAWIGTASVGILLARYYRQTWVGTSLCGKDLWFAVSLLLKQRTTLLK